MQSRAGISPKTLSNKGTEQKEGRDASFILILATHWTSAGPSKVSAFSNSSL
jgi:hypothetical protein